MVRIYVLFLLVFFCLPAFVFADAADDDWWDDDDDDFVDEDCESASNCIDQCFEKGSASTDKDECPYAEGFTWLYNYCGFILYDAEFNEMTLDEAIADCNECVGMCGDYYAGLDDDTVDDDDTIGDDDTVGDDDTTGDDDTAGGDDDETAGGDDDNDDNDDSGGCEVSSGTSSTLLTILMVAVGLLSFVWGLRTKED